MTLLAHDLSDCSFGTVFHSFVCFARSESEARDGRRGKRETETERESIAAAHNTPVFGHRAFSLSLSLSRCFHPLWSRSDSSPQLFDKLLVQYLSSVVVGLHWSRENIYKRRFAWYWSLAVVCVGAPSLLFLLSVFLTRIRRFFLSLSMSFHRYYTSPLSSLLLLPSSSPSEVGSPAASSLCFSMLIFLWLSLSFFVNSRAWVRGRAR